MEVVVAYVVAKKLLVPLIANEFDAILSVKKDVSKIKDLQEQVTGWISALQDIDVEHARQFHGSLIRFEDFASEVKVLLGRLEAGKHQVYSDGSKRGVAFFLCAKPRSFMFQWKAAHKIKAIKESLGAIEEEIMNANTVINNLAVDYPLGSRNRTAGQLPVLGNVQESQTPARDQEKGESIWSSRKPRRFRYRRLATATDNFSDKNMLGRGGFGPVYRGYLRDQDLHVAVKVSSDEGSSGQGKEEFEAEVKVMAQLRHMNVVQLVGWCDSNKKSNKSFLLVYELMSGGSLDKHLYNPEKLLTWQQRYKIILDLGSALLYLHQRCESCIVHGDIKPANVMLDVSLNAKLGDFGQARLLEHGAEPETTEIIAGTLGYIDPAFVNDHLRRPESDVYSFGVVLLEIACGRRPGPRRPAEASALLTWVHALYDQNKILDAADRRLNGEFDQQQMERVLSTGLWCAHRDPSQRPSIAQAMDDLRSPDVKLWVLPTMRHADYVLSLEELAYGDLPASGTNTSAVVQKDQPVYLHKNDECWPSPGTRRS